MVDIEIEIDGKVVHGHSGEPIISIADREGIEIPRFCYHKKLSVSANCRMCLVDVEGNPKPQPACSTPASAGMRINTANEKAKASQKAVMEFLLINHPLDCPICDQGGECELQDVAMEYGSDVSKFSEGKRIVADKGIGALIQTDMTRCIHCTRCVRFGTEVAGVVEMGGTGRGEDMKIEPFLTEGIQSELSGNMIDVCPVGALTSKPFRYEVRSWQMNSSQSVARHDLVGSSIFTQTHKGKVKRVVASDKDSVNETWISDRDRFSYEGLASENRALTPKIKVNGEWQETSWEDALQAALSGIQNSAENIGSLASNNATLEELYLLQKLTRGLGSDNLDTRLDVANPGNAAELESNISLLELEEVDHALLVNSYLRLEQPMINHRIRKATLNGAKVTTVNAKVFDFNYRIDNTLLSAPQNMAATLSGILKALLEVNSQALPDYLKSTKTEQSHIDIANALSAAQNAVIVLGEHINSNPCADQVAQLVAQIAKASGAKTLNASKTGNAIAANKVGFQPSTGMSATQMLSADLKAFVLLDVYPTFDCINPQGAIENLSRADCFVVALSSFEDEAVSDFADVILPIASFYETSGTHINIENVAQSYNASVKAAGDSKPGWKVIKVLADLLELPGFDYTDSTQVADDALSLTPNATVNEVEMVNVEAPNVATVWQYTPYVKDALTRHATSLQQTQIGQVSEAAVNEATAKLLELSVGDLYKGIPININETVAEGCVFVYTNQARQR
jgi:NADH-quinone oxidoreductase subunit G